MEPGGETARGEARGGDRRGGLEGRRRPRAWVLLQGGILVALAVTASGLLYRADTLERGNELSRRARSLAELVAHSAGPDVPADAPSRAQTALSTAARGGIISAGAVLDADGTIVAHTDVARIGERSGAETESLFPGTRGIRREHPLGDPSDPAGRVVVLVPQVPAGTTRAVRFLVPPALVLLAFVATGRAVVRRTLARTSDFLSRLDVALEAGDAPEPPSDPRDPAATMDRAVARTAALAEARHDLTVRNQILTYKKDRMELILDRFPDGLIVTDPARNVTFANRAAARTLGAAGADLVGRNLRDTSPALRALVDEADRSGRALVPPELAGPERSLSLARAPLIDAGNGAAGTLYTVRDVTAQQAAQRTQAEFLSQVTHELKAPLHTIVTYVEELADDEGLSREERSEYANTLNSEVDRMAQLISNLLQLSRIQLGNLSAQRGFVKPAPLIVEQASSLRAAAEDRQLALQVTVPENLPAVHGDKDLLGVAITNLLTNAIKYTPPGGRIAVSASVVAGGISIEIADTGVGIPPEQQSRVFERFARSEQAWVQEQSGSGLGLSLVKEIVEIHDGQISLDSTEGRGSTFRIWLPCREAGRRADVVEALA